MLKVDVLRSGERIVRPKGALGTCGFWPRAWQAACVGRRETDRQAFLRANPNWQGFI